MKKVLCLAVAVGNVSMTDDQLVKNINLAINFLVISTFFLMPIALAHVS